ncbi:hypothetical protein [Novosphingobium sp. ZW T3_23]|uniref:hypothetical protein n=1 Tax=Novosphingobium sp. ZW T3_23 TaxID=3378084 RepID=UPI0038546C7E
MIALVQLQGGGVIVSVFKAMFLFILLVMATAPRASLWGRAWRNGLVRPLCRSLSRITCGHVLLVVGIGGFLAFVSWLIGAEGLHISAMALPELTSWAMMFEVSTLLDAMAALMIFSATVRVKAALALASRLLSRRPRRLSRPPGRTRKRRGTPRRVANDDEGPADGLEEAA